MAPLAAFFEATTIDLPSVRVCRSLLPCVRVSRRSVLASRTSGQVPRSSRERSKCERKSEVLRKKGFHKIMPSSELRGSSRKTPCFIFMLFTFSSFRRIHYHPHSGRPILAGSVVGDTHKHRAHHCRWSNPKNSTRGYMRAGTTAVRFANENLTLYHYMWRSEPQYLYHKSLAIHDPQAMTSATLIDTNIRASYVCFAHNGPRPRARRPPTHVATFVGTYFHAINIFDPREEECHRNRHPTAA